MYKYLLLFLTLMLLSCNDNSTVSINKRHPLQNLPSNLDGEIIYCVSGYNFDETIHQPDIQFLHCYAYLSDDFSNNNSAYVNNVSLDRIYNNKTQLTAGFDYNTLPSSNLSWKLSSNTGIVYQFTQRLTNKLVIESPEYLDTISRNSTLLIRYSGASSNPTDSIKVTISPAIGENGNYKNIYNGNCGGSINFYQIDNGTIVITPEMLNSLGSNSLYYSILIENYKSDKLVINNRIFYCISKYYYRTAFLLS